MDTHTIYNVSKVVLNDLARRLKLMDTGKVDGRWTLPYNLEPLLWPMNWETQRLYSGLNVVTLDHYGAEYLTMRQIMALKRRKKYQHIHLREGSMAHEVVYALRIGPAPFVRRYQLYAVDDIEGLEVRRHGKLYQHTPTEAETELETVLHSYFQREQIGLRHIKSAWCRYIPEHHRIDIPHHRYFRRYSEYLSSLSHEAIHSTAGAMGRELDFDRDLAEYAIEELTAELGAALLLHIYNVADETTAHNNATYLRTYLRRMDAPTSMLHTAMDTARAAVESIIKLERSTAV